MRTMVQCALVLCLMAGCEHAVEAESRESKVRLAIAERTFTLDLALDSASRTQGLGERKTIGAREGMLMVLPQAKIVAACMRDSWVPIDVAFLDEEGQVLVTYTMSPEPPRRPGERGAEYEARLPLYSSRVPVLFVLEVAGGRLAELGVAPGHKLRLDWNALAHRAR